ncbi:MAG: hypothetical protein PVI54_10770, partial [Desulfobacteraceae bacterium]
SLAPSGPYAFMAIFRYLWQTTLFIMQHLSIDATWAYCDETAYIVVKSIGHGVHVVGCRLKLHFSRWPASVLG